MRHAGGWVRRVVLCLQVAVGILHGSYASAQDTIGQRIVEVVVEQEGEMVTDPLIRGLIETTVGEPLSMRDVRETIDHLANLRRFDDIQPVAEAVDGGVRLRYLLFPSHPVDRVEFRGTLGVSAGDLRRVLAARFGTAPAAGRADEAAELLRRSYRDRGYWDARISTRLEQTHKPDRATLFFEIDAGRRARIAGVQLFQLDQNSDGALVGTPDIAAGEPYDFEEIERRLRRWEDNLRSRGYYEARASHGAYIDPAGGDAFVTVNITRGPRVTVAFAGDPLPQNERERLVPVRAEGSADEDLLEDARLAIERYLRGRGYRDAAAPYTRAETPGELTITFTVARGPRYVVDAVTVAGNTAVPSAELQELIGFERGDPFVRAALNAAATNVQNVYRARGYTGVKVEAREAVLPEADGDRRVEVGLIIAEGRRTFVRAVTFEGNTALAEEELRALATATPGAAFSQGDVVNSRDRIELEYRNRGYETAQVTSSVTAGDDETQVDVRYAIAEGPQSIIDHIIVVGNERTSLETITDELLFREGDPLGYSALIDSRARLAALGLFRRVDIQPLQHTGESRRDVLVQVEEADPWTIGWAGGGELALRARPTGPGGVAEERWEVAPRASLEVGRRNLWGSSRSVNLFTRVSLRSTDVVIGQGGLRLEEDQTESNLGFNEYRVVGTFREPRLFSSGAELILTGIVEQAIRTTFNFSRRIVRAETGFRVARAVAATGRYSFERTQLFDEIFTPEEKPRIDRFFPQVRLSKFSGSLIHDTRDDLVEPTRGRFLILDGDLAARAIGSEVGFVQSFLQAYTFHQLPSRRRLVVALAGRLGLARGFAREVPVNGGEDEVRDLPASERFFAGGDTTVRGFSLDRLGSDATLSPTGFPLGGNAVVILNSELRVHLFGAWQAVGFFDAGNVFARVGDLDLTDLRPAAGFGIRYAEFGTVRLDLGFNLRRRDLVAGTRERGTVFHISLGQAF